MKIYIDNNFLCHLDNDGTRRSFDVPYFDGKCRILIEGYYFIPIGESWVREDGENFIGEMMTAAYNYEALAAAQQQYEEDESIYLAEIGALIEEIYNEDLEVIG